jgi:hypothetical protein
MKHNFVNDLAKGTEDISVQYYTCHLTSQCTIITNTVWDSLWSENQHNCLMISLGSPHKPEVNICLCTVQWPSFVLHISNNDLEFLKDVAGSLSTKIHIMLCPRCNIQDDRGSNSNIKHLSSLLWALEKSLHFPHCNWSEWQPPPELYMFRLFNMITANLGKLTVGESLRKRMFTAISIYSVLLLHVS